MRIVKTLTDLRTAIKDLDKADVLGYDLETTGLNPHTGIVLIVALASEKDHYCIDARAIGQRVVFKELKQLLETKKLLIHNASFDTKWAFDNGVLPRNFHCSLLTERILSAGLLRPEGFSLKAIVHRYKGLPMEKETRSEFIDNPSIILETRHYEYAITDLIYLFDIYKEQMRLINEQDLRATYDLEMALIPCVAVMEYTGIALDYTQLESLVPVFDKLVKQSERTLQDLFIQSGSVSHILVTKDGYKGVNVQSKPIKRTNKITGEVTYNVGQTYAALSALGIEPTDKKGHPSLLAKNILKWDMKNARDKEYDYRKELGLDDEDTDDLANAITAFEGLKHPILRAYTFYIAATKLRDSYVIGTLSKYLEKTKRVYGWFAQLGARSTGRFSSDMQQIPKDQKLEALSITKPTGEVASIRGCFIAPEGRKLLIADYSGIELVILADLSKDELLGKIIVDSANEIDDMHLYVVRQAFGHLHTMAKDATLEKKKQYPFSFLRNAAKPTSYGIAYGITPYALADTISKELAPLGITCSPKDAEIILNDWKRKAFPNAGKWLDTTSRQAMSTGVVQTRMGRKRYFDLEYARRFEWKMHAIGREGCNQPIQGACADIMKLAMIKLFNRLDIRRARIIWTVHDELIIESIDSYVDTASLVMKECMESAAQELLPVMGQYVKVTVNVSDRYNK